MSNIVSITNGEPVTSSLAIAEGVGNSHKTVIQLIRGNISDLEEFGTLAFEMRKSEGRPTEFALLNEQQATLLMTYMRNNDVVRAFKKRLVKAFYELSHEQAPKSFSEALRLAADQAERLEVLESQRAEDAPKVKFHDQVAVAPDAISLAKAAKAIGTGRNRLMAFLRQIGWITRHNEPYQEKIEAGYLDVKVGSWSHPDHGLQQSITALVTGKGLTKIQKLWSEHKDTAA